MLQYVEAVGYKVSKPEWYIKDVILVFFLVHGCPDFVNVHGNGRLVALVQIYEGIGPRGVFIKVVWAPHSHDLDIVGYELLVYAMMVQGSCDPWYVTVGSGAVVA